MDEPLINPKKFPKAIMKCKDRKTSIGFSDKIISKQDIQYIKLLDQYINELLEEELRIFYVACTRAKHRLIFSSCKNINFNNSCVSQAKWLSENENHYT